MNARLRRKTRGRPRYPGLFTPAEERVRALLGEGLTNTEIAARTGLSIHTVHTHIANMLAKSGAADRSELASFVEVRDEARGLAWLVPMGRIVLGSLAVGATVVGSLVVVAALRSSGDDAMSLAMPGTAPTNAAGTLRTVTPVSDPGALLSRPLDLPLLGLGKACPVGPIRTVNPRYSPVVGPGPAYAAGLVALQNSGPFGVGGDAVPPGVPQTSGYAKTLIAIGPGSAGPLLIRGARLDGSGALQFDQGGQLLGALLAGPLTQSDGWRDYVFGTIAPDPGCYAIQVDGLTFQEIIVFEAHFTLVGRPGNP